MTSHSSSPRAPDKGPGTMKHDPALPHVTTGDRKRILVAMSGGVDSSVVAALLVESGHEVIGATMKTFCYEETSGPSRTCCGLDGILDARRVADHLGVPHYVFDVEEEFTRDVIDDFVSEYAQGRTPNPCVRCNANTKFRDLMKRGKALGCDGIATGHYARTRHANNPGAETEILRGVDREKDQSYFLWDLPTQLLPLLHFPLGDLSKAEVRERARALELATAEKPESQEICFVPMGNYRDFLRKRLPARHPALEPGNIVNRDGDVVGEHEGYAGFTIGQRKGLGGGLAGPMYVLEIRPEKGEVVVGPQEELLSARVRVEDVNWLTHRAPATGEEVRLQVRHRAPDVRARVERITSFEMVLRFLTPERAVAPGQSAAVFVGERLLGGGRIAQAWATTTSKAPWNESEVGQ